MYDFDIFIGLEIHVQLLTESKIFCACPVKFGEEANTNVCPVCLGFPGMLPVPNMQAIEYAYTLAQALQCTLAPTVKFDRKNYYYPDLPKNYQITQFYNPAGKKGKFDFLFDNKVKTLAITEAHLEEDAGKLIHTSDVSLCDYNRSGTPLLEVVTEPDIKSPKEAEAMLKQFRQLVRYLGVCDGNMEEGSMRCDANISINHKGKGLGSKVEIKNVNSFRFVGAALEYEVARQAKMLENNERIVQETRLWNENKDITESMRSKEEAFDYRYIPEQDIVPYTLPQAFFDTLSQTTIELPLARRLRFEQEYKLKGSALEYFTEEKQCADFYEDTVKQGAAPTLVATWISGDVQKLLNKKNMTINNSPLSPFRLAQMLVLLQEGTLHGKLAKIILEKVFEEDADPKAIIQTHNIKASTPQEIEAAVAKVLAAQQKGVEQYKQGDKKPLAFLLGV